MEKLNDKKGKFKFISRKYTDNAIAKMTNINRKNINTHNVQHSKLKTVQLETNQKFLISFGIHFAKSRQLQFKSIHSIYYEDGIRLLL